MQTARLPNRIKTLMKEKGFTREALAEAVDAHPVTISKLIAGTIDMTTSWMERLGAALGVPPIEILSSPAMVRTVTVKASVQAGVWSENSEWPDRDDWYEVAIPRDAELDGIELFAAEVRGASMNRRYAEGSVVVCTAPWQDNEAPIPGRRYIVERRRLDGTIETTVKLLHRDPDGGLWLLAESDDPRFQTPIPVDGGSEDEEIRVIGRVRYAVSRE
ncbi:hypothetical protein ATO4_19944 [Aurantimonas sp. 22II-16-19i]|nr:hypothetical protein ATO4_19944 [Aurantimonas sp. 22II-16-19i]